MTKQSDGCLKVTSSDKVHVNCLGGKGWKSNAAVTPILDKFVRANPKISGPALQRLLKEDGVAISQRSANRAKRTINENTSEEESEAYARPTSFLAQVQQERPGSVATVKVSIS